MWRLISNELQLRLVELCSRQLVQVLHSSLVPFPDQIKSHFIGHIHMVSRCYCECSEMLVLLVPTVQQYLTSNLTIPQQLPSRHKSKQRDGIRIYTYKYMDEQ